LFSFIKLSVSVAIIGKIKITVGFNEIAFLKFKCRKLYVALVKPQPGHSMPNVLT
jgi:hypothetical protein